VDSLEHGYFVAPAQFDAYDPALADRLAGASISVTPTLQVFRDMAELLPAGAEQDFWRRRRDTLATNVGRLHHAGVTLTAGSDAGWRLTRFDNFARGMEQLQDSGRSTL